MDFSYLFKLLIFDITIILDITIHLNILGYVYQLKLKIDKYTYFVFINY